MKFGTDEKLPFLITTTIHPRRHRIQMMKMPFASKVKKNRYPETIYPFLTMAMMAAIGVSRHPPHHHHHQHHHNLDDTTIDKHEHIRTPQDHNCPHLLQHLQLRAQVHQMLRVVDMVVVLHLVQVDRPLLMPVSHHQHHNHKVEGG
jgi:hypothetical protein